MPPVLLHVFQSLEVGGQQTRFATMANRLGRSYRHLLISLSGRAEAVALLDPDLDATLLPVTDQTTSMPRLLRIIARQIAKADPEVLVTYNWGTIEWAIVNRIAFRRPHIHLEDGFGPDEADGQKRRRVLARRFALSRSTVVVPSSTLVGIASAVWRLDAGRVIHIPNGIDPARFDDIHTSGSSFFSRTVQECVVGSVTALRREKNIGRLLHAFAQVAGTAAQPIRLVICGDGPERGALGELAGRLGIDGRVDFAGQVPKPEAVMGAFDLFAITSDTEQMPYSVLEAMAAGLPILATDVGDIAAMVCEENRPFVVPRDDPDRLALALAQLCRDPELRRRVGKANRLRVEERFRIPPMVEAFRRVLEHAVAASRRETRSPVGRSRGFRR